MPFNLSGWELLFICGIGFVIIGLPIAIALGVIVWTRRKGTK